MSHTSKSLKSAQEDIIVHVVCSVTILSIYYVGVYKTFPVVIRIKHTHHKKRRVTYTYNSVNSTYTIKARNTVLQHIGSTFPVKRLLHNVINNVSLL